MRRGKKQIRLAPVDKKRKKKTHAGRWIAVLVILSVLYGCGAQNAEEDVGPSTVMKTALPVSAELTLPPDIEAQSERKGEESTAERQTLAPMTALAEEGSEPGIGDEPPKDGSPSSTAAPAKSLIPEATVQPTAQPTAQPEARQSAEQVLFEGMTNNTVNVRAEASKDSKRIDQLQKGIRVQVLDVQTAGGKDWYKVRYGEEKLGFVFGSYVDRQISVTMLNRTFTAEEIDTQVLSGMSIPDSQALDDAPVQGAATAVFEGSGVYSGGFSEGRRAGQGTYVWENGDVYEGEWKDDRLSGEGVLTLADGTVYEGKFLRGTLKSGTIRKYQGNGALLTRTVSDGEMKKKAFLSFEDGTIVEGNVSKGEISGSVTILYPNGDQYEGTIEDSLKSGQGTYTWADGAHYTGAWKSDKMNGSGTYYFSQDEKRQYVSGKFADNQPTGDMTYMAENGIKYTTQWENGSCVRIEYRRK